ncbi:MAG: ATP-grasp domain-containing protein [Oceanospirillaceae bacterium]|nr:ATP-grasp domain-containing protein [Oceanospirillaceae bacterium]
MQESIRLEDMPRILFVGGGYSDIPLIKAARETGYYVITTGNDPKGLGHQYADEYCPADYADPDDVLRVAIAKQVDAIFSGCNDFAAVSSAYVAEKLHLPGHDSYETSKLLHHKDRLRDFLAYNSLPSPTAVSYTSTTQALSEQSRFTFPVMVKPVDLTGGKGISLVRSSDGFYNALQKAFLLSKAKRVVVEEYVEGSRHGFSGLLCGGKLAFHFVDNEHYYLNPYMVSAASYPSRVPEYSVETLVEAAETIADLLNLVDGIFHVQFILSSEGIKIIEICRRPPGDLYVKLVEHVTFVDYSNLLLRCSLGLPFYMIETSAWYPKVVRHCVMADRTGFVRDVYIAPEISRRIIDSLFWWNQGDIVSDPLTYKAGIVFLDFSDCDDVYEEAELLKMSVYVQVEAMD